MVRKSSPDVGDVILTPADCRGARGILRWSQTELAERSAVLRVTIARFEQQGTIPVPQTLTALRRTFEDAGIFFSTDSEGSRHIGDATRWILLAVKSSTPISAGDRITVLKENDSTAKCANLTSGTVCTIVDAPRYGEWTHNYGKIGDAGIITVASEADTRPDKDEIIIQAIYRKLS